MNKITLTDQTVTFLMSILMGACFCLFYDLFRFIRKHYKCRTFSVFITDLFYWIVVSFVTYSFLIMRCKGEIRGFVIIGCVFGFVLSRILISNIFLNVMNFVFVWVKKLIFTPVFYFLKKTEQIFIQFFSKTKKVLKRGAKMVYNTLKGMFLNKNKIPK